MTKIKFASVLEYIIKIVTPIILTVGVCGSAYYKYYIEPRFEKRLQPLTIFVLETNLLLRKMAPDSVKQEVEDELKSYTQYFGIVYPDMP